MKQTVKGFCARSSAYNGIPTEAGAPLPQDGCIQSSTMGVSSPAHEHKVLARSPSYRQVLLCVDTQWSTLQGETTTTGWLYRPEGRGLMRDP